MGKAAGPGGWVDQPGGVGRWLLTRWPTRRSSRSSAFWDRWRSPGADAWCRWAARGSGRCSRCCCSSRFHGGAGGAGGGRHAEAAGTLRAALGLWRSGVLADLADYAFTRPEAARLEELRLAAVEARIDADLALGRHDALTAELEQLAAGHPLRSGCTASSCWRCTGRPAGRRAGCLPAGPRPARRRARHRPRRAAAAAARIRAGTRPGTRLARRPGDGIRGSEPGCRRPGRRPPSRRRGLGSPRRGRIASPADRAEACAGLGAMARPAPAGHRLGAGGRGGRVRGRGGPAVGRRASRPAGRQCRPDRPGRRTGGRAVDVGNPAGLAYGDGSVWAADSADGMLWRIDPATCRGAADSGRVRAERGGHHRPGRVGHQQRRRDGGDG